MSEVVQGPPQASRQEHEWGESRALPKHLVRSMSEVSQGPSQTIWSEHEGDESFPNHLLKSMSELSSSWQEHEQG